MQEPLVSCLCLTRNRPLLLRRSVQCFLDQTYTNTELVILLPEDDLETREMISSFRDNRIRFYTYGTDNFITMGMLRNMSIAKSTGEYFCQWDDDDWYHSRRIEMQLQALFMARKQGSVLAYHILYDQNLQTAYTSFACPWPQTILCKRELFNKYTYPDTHKQEDALYLAKLLSGNHMVPVGWASLYIYVYHKTNITPGSQFNEMIKKSMRLPESSCGIITDILENKYPQKKASLLMDSDEVLGNINYFSGSY